MKVHTTLDLDRELLQQAAVELGTTRTTDTVHAALREVVARSKRRWLAERDYSELEELLPDTRRSRGWSSQLRPSGASAAGRALPNGSHRPSSTA